MLLDWKGGRNSESIALSVISIPTDVSRGQYLSFITLAWGHDPSDFEGRAVFMWLGFLAESAHSHLSSILILCQCVCDVPSHAIGTHNHCCWGWTEDGSNVDAAFKNYFVNLPLFTNAFPSAQIKHTFFTTMCTFLCLQMAVIELESDFVLTIDCWALLSKNSYKV